MKTTSTDGLRKILGQRIEINTEKNIRRLLNRAALRVENTAKESIQRGVKSGRVYTKGGITHQASAEGEAPATDTGFLVSNISHNTVRAEGTKLISQVFSGAEYSAYLEFGTRKMAERPFLQPALDENAPKIEADFRKGGLIK